MRNFKFFRGDSLPEMDLEMLSREIHIPVRSQEYIPAGFVNVNLPSPEAEDELYMEVEDVDTGECFGIPAAMSYAISYRGRILYDNSRTVSGRCDYGTYEYWIDNIYSTLENTLVISVTVSVPFGAGNGRVTFHKFRQIIPYETI